MAGCAGDEADSPREAFEELTEAIGDLDYEEVCHRLTATAREEWRSLDEFSSSGGEPSCEDGVADWIEGEGVDVEVAEEGTIIDAYESGDNGGVSTARGEFAFVNEGGEWRADMGNMEFGKLLGSGVE
jgi:hypothetical protein